MTDEEIENMDDERYTELAARAMFIEERETEKIKAGILKAITEVLQQQ